jgi:hypothetical protein
MGGVSSGADLFVVCKRCGSEVSSYITECPYCGNRLRRRAPKLPREHTRRRATHRARLPAPSLGRLRRGEIEGVRGEAAPYATIALVAASGVMWVLTSGGYVGLARVVVVGPLHGEWWKLFTNQFGYWTGFTPGVYALAVLAAAALFGWLLERRHGPLAVLVTFFGAGATGALAALAAYPAPVLAGANAGALGLLAAWTVPDIQAARARRYYDGDLLGAATIAVVLLVLPLTLPTLPFVHWGASWLAGLVGGMVGLVLGYGLSSTRARTG